MTVNQYNPLWKNNIILVGLLILYCLSVIIHLGYQELGAEEPRRAIVSLEMLHSGNYIKATQMGETYINKPVLYNWIQCGFMKISGSSSELILRLPSLLFYLVLGFFHYRVSKL